MHFQERLKRLNFFQSAHKTIIYYLPLLSRAAGDQQCPACSYATHIKQCNRKKANWKISLKINMVSVKRKKKLKISTLMKGENFVISSKDFFVSNYTKRKSVPD